MKTFNPSTLRAILLFGTFVLSFFAFGQNNVGIGTTTPRAKALLDLNANNLGLLLPRVDRALVTPGLAAADNGLLVYDTTAGNQGVWYWNGLSWSLVSSFESQAANTVFAAPNGAAGLPSFRLLVANDIPNLNTSKLTAGILPIARGGTNSTATPTNGGISYGTGTAYAFTAAGTAGQILQSNGAGAPVWVNAPALGWQLTGNSGITPGINFIGTTDAQELRFRVNNQHGGEISPNGFAPNTSFGYLASPNPVVGEGNSAFGASALGGITTGYLNVAVGYQALMGNTTGYGNTAAGGTALFNNNGIFNSAFGFGALHGNTTGTRSVGVGVDALRNSNASGNTAVGFTSLIANTSGQNNTAIGYLTDVLSGSLTNATAIGYNAKVGISNAMVLGGTGADIVNVGIGTSAPSQRLHVEGNILFSGALMPNNVAGTAGQVLTSAGPGLPPVWSAVGGGWGLSGNAGTVPGTNFIGTTDNVALRFRTNGADRLTISNSGSVGIGTTAPSASAQLHVFAPTGNLRARFETGGGTLGPYLALAHSGGREFIIGSTGTGNSSGANKFEVFDATASQARLVIDAAGNVGLGTTAPRNDLQIGDRIGLWRLNMFNQGTVLSSNIYLDAGTPRYITNAQATLMAFSDQGNGNRFTLAMYPTGTAGSALGSEVPLLQIDSSGNTSIRGRFRMNGELEINSSTGFNGDLLVSQGPGNAPVWQSVTNVGWGLLGNAGTNPVFNYMGTDDAQALSIRTNAQERIGISAIGNVNIAGNGGLDNSLYVQRLNTNPFGIGTSSIYGFRPGSSINATDGGSSWAPGGVDAAVKGFSAYGNYFTAGVAGFNYDFDFGGQTGGGRSGVLGANQGGTVWASLMYHDGNNVYGVYTPNNAYVGGNLGIRATVPSGILDVRESFDGDRVLLVNGRNVRLGDMDGGGAGANLFIDGDGAGNFQFMNGNVGIGTTSPGNTIQVNGTFNMGAGNNVTGFLSGALGSSNSATGNRSMALGNFANAIHLGSMVLGDWSGSSPSLTQSTATDQFTARFSGGYRFFTNSALTANQGIYFNSGGNVGIGTGSPLGKLHVENADWGISPVHLSSTGSSAGATIRFANSGGREYDIIGSTGTGASTGVGYFGIYDNTGGAYRFVISPSGNVGIGLTNPGFRFDVQNTFITARFFNSANTSTSDVLRLQGGSNSTAGSWMIDFRRNDLSLIGTVSQNSATSVSYNTTSDRRLKNVMGESIKGIDDLMKIKIYDYTYKSDSEGKVFSGFVAQELYEVFPQSVTPPREGDPSPAQNPWMVDYGSVSPLIIKAVQDQQKVIENLMQEVERLKALLK